MKHRMFKIFATKWILVCMLLSCIRLIDSACTNDLPLSAGTWKTSSRGSWTVTTSTIRNFEVTTSSTAGPFTVTMNCEDDSDSGGYIALKSQSTYNLFGGPKYVYACIKFEEQTTNMYYFYLGSSLTTLATGVYERIILLPTSVTFDILTFCNNRSTDPDRTHVAIKDGEAANVALTCPSSIQGTFSYSDTSCSTTFLDVCTTLTEFNFNYTVCAEQQLFSETGQLYCVHSGTNAGYNYLTLYNTDSSPDGSTYYQYSCMVYSTSDKTVTASINPKECFGSGFQTPTSTNHPSGVTRTFTNYGDSPCYTTSSTDLLWLYILIAILLVIIIIAIIIFVICYLKRKKKREQNKSDEESLHPSESDEEQKTTEEEQKKTDKQRTESPIPVKEEDRASIDSGIEQEKKEEPKPPPPAEKDKKVVIEDKKEEKDKEEINVAEKKEKEEEKEVDEQEESSSSDETEESSRVTTPDPEEIERNIRKIGMKKSTNFTPQGKLSKVLVSREMEEKSRKNKEKGKWRKMKSLFRGKTKKIQAVNQTKEEEDKDRRESTPDSEHETREKTVALFMKEYEYKKNMEQMLEEQHVWGGEPDYTQRLQDSDDEDFADIFKEEKTTDENDKGEQTKVERMVGEKKLDENTKDEQTKKRKEYIKEQKDREHLVKLEKDRKKEMSEEQAKDSGVDSPDFKREKTDTKLTDEDEDMEQREMTEPPPGYIKDSAGQIIRLYDGKVMTQEEMQSIFPLAKLGMLFHVPRLKRTSHGRPTGDYIEDPFGPKIEKDKSSSDFKDEHSKPKHPRSSRASARRDPKEITQKTVAFDVDDRHSDILMIEDEDDRHSQIDRNSADRDLLRKRLFRNKRKPRSRGASGKMYLSDDSKPRELSDLVRVIPQNNANKYAVNGRAPIPGTVISRNDSMKNKFDPEQQQIYREGLATDKRILDRSPSLKRRPPGAPREAFVDNQDPDDIRVSIENEENENRQRRFGNGINIGSDDEFFLVGNDRDPQERLFTHVTRPGQTTVRPLPGSNDMFCPKHDMRHALPWSLINQYQIRESSILDANSIAKKNVAPKSADNAKRCIDDRRLKELLEELYKDKKYFDHVIDTTEPNSEPIIDERDLAEHGREFLLERAEYWDERGELPPRPPQTALGLRLSRMQTTLPESGRVSNISYASTVTPQPPPEHLPRRNELPQAFNRRENTIS